MLFIVSVSPATDACTGFAVYGKQTIYGMNFDYLPHAQQKISISSEYQGRVFHLSARTTIGFMKIVGMNSQGLFASCQMLFPQGYPPLSKRPEHISAGIFHQMALSRFADLGQVRSLLDKRQVIQVEGVSLHNLVADRHGDAIVVEAGEANNHITSVQDGVIVMTNFSNHRYKLNPIAEKGDNGVTRYRIAHAYIQNNLQSFDVQEGIALLRLVQIQSDIYATRCSLVFKPHAGEVYICLENNFDKVWKISLKNQTIETYGGFQSHRRRIIPADGLLTTELVSL